MNAFKTLLAFLFAGAFLGGVLASWIGPGFLEWYNTAGSGTQMLCDMPTVVRDITSTLLRYQLIGSGVGALTGLVLGAVLMRLLARRSARQAAPAS